MSKILIVDDDAHHAHQQPDRVPQSDTGFGRIDHHCLDAEHASDSLYPRLGTCPNYRDNCLWKPRVFGGSLEKI